MALLAFDTLVCAHKINIADIRKDIETMRLSVQKDIEIVRRDMIIGIGSIITLGGGIMTVIGHFWH